MRSLVVAMLLLTTLVPFVPGAAAKSLAEDPQGDVQLQAFGLPAAPAGAQGDAADLLAMDLVEDAEQLAFTLKVANLQQTMSFAEYEIMFVWNDAEYRVVIQRQVAQGVFDDSSNAYLVAQDEDGDWDMFSDLEHTVDVESGLLNVWLPKAYLLDEDGRFPLLGDDLEDLHVEARNHVTVFQFASDAYDRMPDGEDTLEYPFLFGDLAAGHLRLDANERVRVSNGGATTFVYQATIANTGEEDDMVDIVLAEMPEGWNGTVQSPIRVPAGGEKRIAVLVSVPFEHIHGGFSSFNLTVTSQDSPTSMAAIRMGVLHTPIPQPAGHHQELYLHARNFNSGIIGDALPFAGASMNTDSVHDADAAEVGANFNGDGLGWWIPLDPGLRMGLDFDVATLGEIAGSIVGHGPSTGSLRAELILTRMCDEEDDGCDGGELLAESDEVPLTLDLSNPVPFKLVLTPTPESDYIAYEASQNLVLLLQFEADEEGLGSPCCLPGTTPALQTADFLMKLPLLEYHDRLTGLGETDSALSIKAEGAVEKSGLPGTTMTYLFTITNHGADEETVDLDLAGTDALLGELVPQESVTLAGREKRQITLAVTIPADANDGEELEVLIFAHAREDPSKSAIARTKTLVAKTGSQGATADESAVLHAARDAESKDTPAPGALLVVGAVAVGALMLRRRR